MYHQTETEDHPKLILSVSAVTLNFDFVSSDPNSSRADEIRVPLVKNKKPSRRSKEGKPPGRGLPTGQVDEGESLEHAIEREARQESGYSVKRIIGKLFVVNKYYVNNEIHLFLVELNDLAGRVTETDEIDASVDPLMSLRQAFELPLAQDRDKGNKNPEGIYFSHRQRLFRAIETMLRHPKDLIDGTKIADWLKPNRKYLMAAMADLEEAGLLDELHDQYTHYEEAAEEVAV